MYSSVPYKPLQHKGFDSVKLRYQNLVDQLQMYNISTAQTSKKSMVHRLQTSWQNYLKLARGCNSHRHCTTICDHSQSERSTSKADFTQRKMVKLFF